MKTINEQIEAQTIISNINIMREKIGVQKSEFKFLWSKSIQELRTLQDQTIQHYNEALKNQFVK